MQVCKFCEKDISYKKDSRAKFCSHSCAASFNNKGRSRNETRNCSECNEPISSNRVICSPECYGKRRARFKEGPIEKREKDTKRSRERRKEFKTKAILYLGGKCIKCDYAKSMNALEFHHRNPNEKEFSLSKALTGKWKWERLKAELDKCDLLCANCHREVHDIYGAWDR